MHVLAAGLMGLIIASASRAQVISVQFDSNGIAANGYTAGVIPETIWNSDTNGTSYVGPGTSGLSNLRDSTNTVTSISESTINRGTYGPYHSQNFANAGDAALFQVGYLAAYPSPASAYPFTLNLAGLDTSTTYNLILYVESTADNSAPLSATLGSTTYYLDTATSATSSFLQGMSTTQVGATTANYVEFTGITTSDGTLTLNVAALTDADFNVNGFQLQEAPEPPTLVLLSIFAVGLILHLRRKRLARRRF